MSNKVFESGKGLQEKLCKGVDTLADNVASTLGPRGRNVILYDKNNNIVVTKDGVTVANFVDLQDPVENVGAQILKQASAETNISAGDGTTTATVLARSMFKHAQKYISAGSSPIELKRGMDEAVKEIVKRLKDFSIPISSIDELTHIATISANNDESIGSLVSMAIDSAGKDGAITVEEARSLETVLDIVEGFQFDSGYTATAFVTDERRGVVKYDDTFVLVTDEKVDSVESLLPILEIVAREGRPFVVVAEEVEGQALAALIMNAVRGTMRVAAIKAPRYGEERRNILKDLAISVGATFITKENGLSVRTAKLESLGLAKTIEVTKNHTTIVGGRSDSEQVDERIESLKNELGQTEDLYECERIQERITRLASGIAIIRVGAATQVEMAEKKHRVEDALGAVKAAQQEGIVPGGGVTLVRLVEDLEVETKNEDQVFGVNIVKAAVEEPIRQMALNAGESPDLITAVVKSEHSNRGYDFVSGGVVNMIEAGIIDPAKVTRCALQNAVSVAAALINTNYAIIESVD